MRSATILDNAACKGADIAIFFPKSEHRGDYDAARWFCTRCPVAAECLQWAIDTDSRYGMFGGATPKERARVRNGAILADRFGAGHGDKAGTTAGYYREISAGMLPCDECKAAYNHSARARRIRNKAIPA